MQVQRLEDGVVHIELGAVDWSEVVPCLSEAWPLVARAVEEFLRKKPKCDWDRLRAYVRYDSGQIWFSPDPAVPQRNAIVAGVEIAPLEVLYFQLPHADDAAEAFDRAHKEMDRRVFDALRHSALLPGPKASLSALQRIRPHPLTFVQYDDLETERILVDPAELADMG